MHGETLKTQKTIFIILAKTLSLEYFLVLLC